MEMKENEKGITYVPIYCGVILFFPPGNRVSICLVTCGVDDDCWVAIICVGFGCKVGVLREYPIDVYIVI